MPWIMTKYPTACAECGHDLEENERVLYNPDDRKIYCETCGLDVEDARD